MSDIKIMKIVEKSEYLKKKIEKVTKTSEILTKYS